MSNIALERGNIDTSHDGVLSGKRDLCAKSAWIMIMCLASTGGAITPPSASATVFSSFPVLDRRPEESSFIRIKDTSKGFLVINHAITVRNRRIKVDTPRLIQGCDGSDAIILDLDDEWTGLDEILVSIGSGDSRQDAIWDGEPMVIEHVDFPIGYLPVSVTGRTKDGSRSIATARAPHVFFVVRNGRSGQ